jgi:signal transduction histidine kinase
VSRADILVAEDEGIVARHIQQVLQRSGHRVPATVGSGEAAVEKAIELRPDLVLMDVALRGALDGVEAAQRIRKRSGTPVVFVTAFADDATLDRVKLAEPAGFVLKPFDDRELHASVELALHRAASARAQAADAAPAADGRGTHRDRDLLRKMYAASLDAREQEARRIARELHDQAGQLLASLHFALDEVRPFVVPAERQRIPELRAMVDEVEEELRRISREMRPSTLDDFGLAAALELMGRGLGRRAGIKVQVSGPGARMPVDVETNLYRIAQEALANVVRHAGARRARVRLRVGRRTAALQVRDDGRGFVVQDALAGRGERGIGLLGMQERVDALGGRLRIESAPGAGTTVEVRVPLGKRGA